MAMYRIQADERRLQPFSSTSFSERYQEQQLEDWVELNPEILSDGEPLLVIGRQVTTATGGTLDLLCLDADGSTVIVELKRAPTPRDIIAQALEYTAWVATLDGDSVKAIAERYLQRRNSVLSFEEGWCQAFGIGGDGATSDDSSSFTSPALNARQRTFVVIEGASERISSVVRYLRAQGIDIGLLEYRYYKTEGGEEILDVENRIEDNQTPTGPSPTPDRARFTEERVLSQWSDVARTAYQAFRDHLMAQGENVLIQPQKSAISFYKQTRDRRVFLCYFSGARDRGLCNFRFDSLERKIDVHGAIESIRNARLPDVEIRTGKNECSILFPISVDRAVQIADLLIEYIVSKVS